MIKFEHVSKAFGGRVAALSDITVEIPDGQFVFLIGPSGAGKTTLLRLIIGDLLPTAGKVIVEQWNIAHLSQAKLHLLRRAVGTIFQDFKLLPDRTVFENVALVLDILGKKPTEVKEEVADILHLVGLTGKGHLFPLQLSAGEMQRTSIARAIVGGPKILLADEPTGNLDPETAEEILKILQEINKMGTTILMATHNAGIVDRLKKRTILLKQGSIISDESKGRYIIPKVKSKST